MTMKTEGKQGFRDVVSSDVDTRRILESLFLTPMGNLFGSSSGEMVWCPPVCLHSPPGAGKCLGKGTPVLKYDGTIVPVEEVQVGDLLMGPDSKPRRVMAVGRGVGELFEIAPNKGSAWVCNGPHILTLVDSLTDEVRDIPLEELLRMPKSRREKQKLFSVGVDFPETGERLPIDPYFLGVWFGDGTKEIRDGQLAGVHVSKPNIEIKQACEDIAVQFGLRVTQYGKEDDKCPTWNIVGTSKLANPLLDLLRSTVGSHCEIPRSYLVARRIDRAAFLAGFLDTDGYASHGGIEIVQKRRDWADAIAFIARSLGLRVTERDKEVKGYGVYRRLMLSGDFSRIPMRIWRKRPEIRHQKKDPLRTGFSVTPLGEGDYFGFELDGDGRFLLGDFTVTHNTSFFSWLSRRYGVGDAYVNMKPGARGEGAVGVVPLPVQMADGRVVLDFPPPGELVKHFADKRGLILVDDLATMAPALQPAYLDVLQERMLGTYRFGGGVRVFGATNSVEDSAGGWDVAPSVANRMGHLPWADPSGEALGRFLQLKADKTEYDDEVKDLAKEEERVLALWPDYWARASQVFAGFLIAHPSMVRRQPSFGDPQASKAWASPRTIEYASRAYAGGLLHRLPPAELSATVGAFVGQNWANEFETYAAQADLPDPRELLRSVLKGEPIFKHRRDRLDRTTVVLQSCTALVTPTTCVDRKEMSEALWKFMNPLTEECSDILAPCCTQLSKAGLVGAPAAREVLAKMESVVLASKVEDRR